MTVVCALVHDIALMHNTALQMTGAESMIVRVFDIDLLRHHMAKLCVEYVFNLQCRSMVCIHSNEHIGDIATELVLSSSGKQSRFYMFSMDNFS